MAKLDDVLNAVLKQNGRIDHLASAVEGQSGRIDALAKTVENVNLELAEFRGQIKAIPPHHSPCVHDHPAMLESIQNVDDKVDTNKEMQDKKNESLESDIKNNSRIAITASAIIATILTFLRNLGIALPQ